MGYNNNLSVLPFYTSLEQQNARKWWVYGKVYPLFTPGGKILPFQLKRINRRSGITGFSIYTKDGDLVQIYDLQIASMNIEIKVFQGYDIIVFNGITNVQFTLDNGQYYIVLTDGIETWYSEIFTVVNDISGYLKLEWWDTEDMTLNNETIVYTNPSFKNTLYLCSDIAKPEYLFNEDVTERDGYTFPVKQVSEKKYRFSFFASEYLLDVLRFVRMADYIKITKDGHTYDNIDTFLITPEWEDNGDIASVDAEFTTDTVAKKIGRSFIQQ